MESKEIIKFIKGIYKQFNTPPNLAEHMFRAAGVANQICDNWIGPNVKKNDVVAPLLIHDLGNLVKMDFESEKGLKALGKEATRVDYWKQLQQDSLKKYGADDHQASNKMFSELGVSDRIKYLLDHSAPKDNVFVVNSDDFELKIIAYSDQRIGFFGVLSLADRYKFLHERYNNKKPEYTGEKFEQLKNNGFQIEQQVLNNTTLTPEDIDDQAIVKFMSNFYQIDD